MTKLLEAVCFVLLWSWPLTVLWFFWFLTSRL